VKRVTLYTRPGCHLCEVVEATIEHVSEKRPLVFERRSILDDAGIYEQYKDEIPVVLVDGREVARHTLDAAELIAALDAV
jgi:hypothetical protein